MMEDYINQHYSQIVLIRKDLEVTNECEPIKTPILGRGRGKQKVNNVPLLNNQSNSFSHRLSMNFSTTNEKPKFSFSQRLSTIQNKTKSIDNLIIDQNKETVSFENLNSNHCSTETLINYNYNKPFINEHLYYLLGPGKRQIIEKDQCEILSCLSSGYCRVKTIEQGKEIEKFLYSILPDSLNIDVLTIPDDLSLIICSSAAENIFQQNQIDYAIISEPTKIQLKIEVIHVSNIEHQQYENTEQSSSLSDGKFNINSTGSSINVISGDICQIPIDLMICISTSNNLRDSVLHCAGTNIETQYKQSYRRNDALLLDGGLTKARKILFVPWETEIEETDTAKTKKSLSDLVKWCIDQAKQRDLKSISFPPIGTGQLGLDPFFVCEAMISAASERLHQCKLDISFVIYPSTGIENEDECYQVFRIYLDSLCEQIKIPTSPKRNRNIKKDLIKRDIQSKRILILSNSSTIIKDHNLLIKSLENLIYEEIFNLSLINQRINLDLLIDICLKYNVYPYVDYSKDELKLRGDRDSCLQCFFNLYQNNPICQYIYQNEEKILNCYISLNIDQAFTLGQFNICLKDDEENIYNINLKKFQIELIKTKQISSFIKKELNDKIPPPSSWSKSSLLKIRTIEIDKSLYKTLECFQLFQQTMPPNWQIERIDAIENYPLFIHFMNNNNNNNNQTKLYFHGCSYSSVQSIIHYGLHLTNASNYNNNSPICLTRDVLNSHLYGTRRSTDGKYYIFAVQVAKIDINNDFISLSNDEIGLTLPTYLIVYQQRQ